MLRDSRDARILFGVYLIFAVGMGLYGFVMPAYARELGAGPAVFGAILSCGFALGTLVTIPGGVWADRYDRRLLMIIGWGMCVPAPLFYAWAKNWLWLVPGYALLFGSFFSNPATIAFGANLAEPRNRGQLLGTLNAASCLGFAIGPALGGALIRLRGLQAVFGGAFLCYLASFLLLFLLRPQKGGPVVRTLAPGGRAPEAPAAPAGGSRAARRALAITTATFASFFLLAGAAANYISLYLQDSVGLALPAVALMGTAGSIGGFLAGPLLGRMRDRRGTRLALPLALGLVATGYAGLLAVPWIAGKFVSLMLRGAESAVMSLGQVEIAARSPGADLGRSLAVYSVFTGIGSTVGPYAGGLLYTVGPAWPFVAAAGGCAALTVLAAQPALHAAPHPPPTQAAPGAQVAQAAPPTPAAPGQQSPAGGTR